MDKEGKLSEIVGDDGKLDIWDTIFLMYKDEKSVVDRAAYLQEALEGKCSQEMIDKAISENPAAAGIDRELLSLLADEAKVKMKETLEKREDFKESIGNILKSKSVVKDAASYVMSLQDNKNIRETFRLAQKNLYLFGFPEVEFNQDGLVKGNKNRLCMVLGLSTMMGIENAGEALKALIKVYSELDDAKVAPENLSAPALKDILVEFRKKILGIKAVTTAAGSNPVFAKLLSGAAAKKNMETFSNRITEALSDTALTDPEHKSSEKEEEFAKIFETLK